MQLFWGDIHSHCSISYGFGELQNALNSAKEHLDFCTVTGHAMWPDMPELTTETEYLITYHKTGFEKLKKNWTKVRNTINSYNKDHEFVTFQSYEMHGCSFGDYHLVSPERDLDLVYADNPKDLLKNQPTKKAIMIPHHISYAKGYRGIDWENFDSSISPVVEVYSKHGCSMNDNAPYSYYHNMGARDTHNTVYEGLRRGNKFSFVGSTDHHAGYPGSYGDGKMAVLCEEKTRNSIYNAICKGHTYAVTGDRILCNFSVNGSPFGSVITTNGSRQISFSTEASHFIDKLIIFKNLRPIKILNGETLTHINHKGRYKVRIEMGWGNNTDLYTWNGLVKVENGRLIDIEKCFRGRSILSPSKDITATDDVNNITNRIEYCDEQRIEWTCQTVKNISPLHPSTSSIVLEVDGSTDTVLKGEINGKLFELCIKDLLKHCYVNPMKSYNSQSFKIHQAIAQTQYSVDLNLTDSHRESDCDFYHAEVYQTNGSCAFVSPVYVY